MLFYVFFVCKCVLYYCHRVSTQLQLTKISYRIISFQRNLQLPSSGYELIYLRRQLLVTTNRLHAITNLNVNSKFLPRRGHEGPKWEKRYSPTLGWSTPHPGRFTPRKLVTHCRRSRVDLQAGLDGCGKPRIHRDSIAGPSSP